MVDYVMDTKNKKTIVVSNVIVKGYVKHANGRKTMFEFTKHDFEPKALIGIFEELGNKYN
jgi:hypothetical protein